MFTEVIYGHGSADVALILTKLRAVHRRFYRIWLICDVAEWTMLRKLQQVRYLCVYKLYNNLLSILL